MTKGRVYVTVGGKELKSIVYFDKNNKRYKRIDLSHEHDHTRPHVHHGYFHNENDGRKGYTKLSRKERKMIDRVYAAWYSYLEGEK